jgi:hypothetical protein
MMAVSTGDDGDGEEAVPEEFARDRDKDMADRPLGPGSLCGSYFRCPDPDHPNAESLWLDHRPCAVLEGMVVAQPFASSQTVVYLVEFFGEHGAIGRQQLVAIDQMLHQRWAFYDSEAWLTARPTDEAAQKKEVTNSD